MDFSKIKGVIFDFDGTLADSLGVWESIDVKFMKKRGLEVPQGYVDKISVMNFSQAAAYTIELLGLDETPEEVISEWQELAEAEYRTNVFFKDNAKEFVTLLKARGIKTAVATASEMELVMPALENNGAADLFDAFAVTGEVKRGKGFPDVYDLARERLGLEVCDCVVFEDIAAAVKGAKDGGYKTVAVFDERSIKDRKKLEEIADMYVENYEQLVHMLEGIKRINSRLF